MTFYCGMDLSARDCQVCVIDDHLSILVQQKVRNELQRIMTLIAPFKEHLQTVVERSFAWEARFRRLARDYERLPATLVGFHFLAFIILPLRRFVEIMT